MPSKILGVRPTSPGFGTVLIKPETCGLSWARGTVPTPHGTVSVSWAKENDRLRFEIALPGGTTGTLSMPAVVGRKSLTLDGKVMDTVIQGDRVECAIGPGSHSGIY
jgi:hypothetical protein